MRSDSGPKRGRGADLRGIVPRLSPGAVGRASGVCVGLSQVKAGSLIGVGAQQIRNWIAEERMPDPRTCKDPFEWIKPLLQSFRDAASGRAWARDTKEQRATAVAEKARLDGARANYEELRLARERGDVLDKREVMTAWTNSWRLLVTRLEAMPTRAAPLVVNLDSLRETEGTLHELVHECLGELYTEEIVALFQLDRSDIPDSRTASQSAAAGERVGGRKPKAKPRGKRRAGAVANG